jgi:LAO/AO transport system kinase
VTDADEIAEGIRKGERGALARLISWAEDRDPRFPGALAELYSRVGDCWRIGVTGPPGAGKSTLTNALTEHLRSRDLTVAVLAIDPTSPFSGGALLGDRIRMEDRTADPGVFIRSMASRGSRGGLALAAVDACDAMDAFGFDVVIVETVGVGQAEYDVSAITDTVLVVLCPGAGDGIQAMKAGLLEVADLLVVNKADLDGADRLMLDLSEAVHTRNIIREEPVEGREDWEVPVIATTASRAEGVARVAQAIDEHRAWREQGDLDAARHRRRLQQVRRVVDEMLDEAVWENGDFSERAESALRACATPYDVAREILAAVLGQGSQRR